MCRREMLRHQHLPSVKSYSIKMRKILVTGGSGQLAQAIKHVAQGRGVEVYAPTHAECDICNISSLELAMRGVDVVINAAAYTNVEGAESSYDDAYAVNVCGASNVALVARRCGARLIHISTDYVFGGEDCRTTPYSEVDAPQPINIYGRTKAEGEAEVLNGGGVVIRTSWLYSPWGKNFCRTILRSAMERGSLRVVDDQRGTPTSALSLARCLVALVESGKYCAMSGIYHYSNSGEASWYEFAREIVTQAGVDGCDVLPCSSDEWPTVARRPRYSCLSTERISGIEGVNIEPWREALCEVITIIRQSDEI